MATVLSNKSDLTPSAGQSATGDTRLTAAGEFAGAKLVIESNPDGIGWAPIYVFTQPEAVIIGFAIGDLWRASLSNLGASTRVSLSALSK